MEHNKSTARRPDHRLRPMNERGKFFVTRQWLNSIFMLGALIGGNSGDPASHSCSGCQR